MPGIRRLDLKQFKEEARSGDVTDAGIIKSYVCDEVKALDVDPGHEQDARLFEFAISTETPDRENDSVAVDGWNLDAYRKNPVVMWAHQHDSLPIAKSPAVWPIESQLRAKADFVDSYEINPFARTVAQMLARGLLNAASVGFRPIVYSANENRGMFAYDFLEQELLEWSVVPVPANAEALQGAKGFGIDITPLAEWAEQVLDCDKGSGIWVPKDLVTRDSVEAAWKAARGEAISVQVPKETKLDSTPDPSRGSADASYGLPPDGASAASTQTDTKSGRVLSSANESALRDAISSIENAVQRISGVLSIANPADDATDDDAKSATATTKTSDCEQTKFDHEQITETLKSLLPEMLRDVTVAEIERALAKHTGRVD